MSKTKELLMSVAAAMYPDIQEDEQTLTYLFSHREKGFDYR
jgi:hypothetical protein